MQLTLSTMHQGSHNCLSVWAPLKSVLDCVGRYTKMLCPAKNRSGHPVDRDCPRGSGKQTPVGRVFRGFNSGLRSPAPVHSLANERLMYPDDFRPFRNASRNSVDGNLPVGASVPVLFCTGGPSAVFGGISGVVINAINRVFFGRSFAHIFEKVCEIKPPVADGNPATAVILESCGTWYGASRNNTFPDSMRRGAGCAVCFEVEPVHALSDTSAGKNVSSKRTAKYHLSPTAFARAFPKRNPSVSGVRKAYDRKFPKLLPDLVLNWHDNSQMNSLAIIHERALRIAA